MKIKRGPTYTVDASVVLNYQHPLITADKRLFQKIGSQPGVIFLRDFFKIGNRGYEKGA